MPSVAPLSRPSRGRVERTLSLEGPVVPALPRPTAQLAARLGLRICARGAGGRREAQTEMFREEKNYAHAYCSSQMEKH